MVILTYVFLILGFIFIGIAAFWNWGQVLDESYRSGYPNRAFYYFFSQLYAIYYELAHRRTWPHVATIYGFYLVGCLFFLLAYVAGRQAGVMKP
jgi:hypothetical protein